MVSHGQRRCPVCGALCSPSANACCGMTLASRRTIEQQEDTATSTRSIVSHQLVAAWFGVFAGVLLFGVGFGVELLQIALGSRRVVLLTGFMAAGGYLAVRSGRSVMLLRAARNSLRESEPPIARVVVK